MCCHLNDGNLIFGFSRHEYFLSFHGIGSGTY